MAKDVFLKIDGVPGESQDSKHKGEIDVESYSFGVSQTGDMGFGGGGGAGKANFQDFHFTMRVSKASPKLFEHCTTGIHIPKAVLTCRKAGGKQEEYLKVTFGDLLISSFQTGGSGDQPMEQCSFNFSKINVEYQEQNEKGAVGGPVRFGYDIKKNEKA